MIRRRLIPWIPALLALSLMSAAPASTGGELPPGGPGPILRPLAVWVIKALILREVDLGPLTWLYESRR